MLSREGAFKIAYSSGETWHQVVSSNTVASGQQRALVGVSQVKSTVSPFFTNFYEGNSVNSSEFMKGFLDMESLQCS